jgi:hypothetical protein
LRVDLPDAAHATAFACILPGLGCTARHVVGDAQEIQVKPQGGPPRRVPVLGAHPEDDVALLDLRELRLPPLPVTMLDPPVEGVTVCRAGHPPSHPDRPFARCDPVGGVLLEASERKDGTVLARLVHLGIGLKGDSGSPLYDPATGLVVGMHVAESNGTARASLPATLHDTRVALARKHPWLNGCSRQGSTEAGTRALILACVSLDAGERANHYRQLGATLLRLGRRSEALSAFDEAIDAEPYGATNWLWRALVFPQSAHARDDAAFAFRLEHMLRQDRPLKQVLPLPMHAPALALRDEVAPPAARLASLVAPGACASCPEFCAAARKARDVRLWAVEGANHPAAQGWLQERLAAEKKSKVPLLAIDGRTASGCGKLMP